MSKMEQLLSRAAAIVEKTLRCVKFSRTIGDGKAFYISLNICRDLDQVDRLLEKLITMIFRKDRLSEIGERWLDQQEQIQKFVYNYQTFDRNSDKDVPVEFEEFLKEVQASLENDSMSLRGNSSDDSGGIRESDRAACCQEYHI